MKNIILVFIIGLFSLTVSAQKARVKGVILDEFNNPVENVTVKVGDKGTVSNENGFYIIEVEANTKVTITFSHVSLKKITLELNLKPNEDFELNPVMNSKVEEFGEVFVTGNSKKRIEGVTTIDPVIIRKIPGANAGIENVLKTLAGVNSNNELSTQYSVRGGNYDENLVYVNEIEVYRPFLIRSGQQEGLSFINPDFVSRARFSAGGFNARYNDKLSSVLDVRYDKPDSNEYVLSAGLMGFSATAKTNFKKPSIDLSSIHLITITKSFS